MAIEGLERADLYRCDVDDARADELPETLRGFETIFNPNKHTLRMREGSTPLAGEVWVDEIGSGGHATVGGIRISGRTLDGVRSLERYTAWRMFAAPGEPAGPETVAAATERLLCNTAFQKALR